MTPAPDYRVEAAILCFIEHEGDVLLIEGSAKKTWAGRLDAIGGRVEPGENPVRAAVREIEEETGLVFLPESLQAKGVFNSWSAHGPDRLYGAHRLILLFVARAPHRDVRHSDEGKVRWVPVERLADERNLLPDLPELIPRTLALRPGEWLSGSVEFDGAGGLLRMDLITLSS